MNSNDLFWSRFLELAQQTLKKAVFDFYVEGAQLIGIKDQTASILLDHPYKKDFWEKNFKDLIQAASLETFEEFISTNYIFPEKKSSISTPYNNSPQEKRPIEKIEHRHELVQPIYSDIKPQYTFDNFVQGDNNVYAKAASLAVADDLGTLYNPLFIYGGPGLGKTHLLNAIGNKVLENNPHARIKYVSAETFINEFLEHLRLNKMDDLKKIYRNLDVLLIDDIQSLHSKPSTQEEFFHTFNALHGKNKQIVLTSDRNPDNLDNIEERMVTRFKWGTTSQITPPDFETRVAILRNKCEAYPYTFTDDTLSYLAGQFSSNVRDLEGALKNIDLLATFRKISTITVDIAAEAIRSRLQDTSSTLVIPIAQIQTEVGNFYGISVKEIKGAKRVKHIAHARQVAMYLSREMTDNSLPKIGREFGNRDHTTVMHAHNKIKNMLLDDPNLEIEITTIKNKIR